MPAGAWSLSTPCTDWDAKQLANHVIYEDRRMPLMMTGKTIAEGGGHGTTVGRFVL